MRAPFTVLDPRIKHNRRIYWRGDGFPAPDDRVTPASLHQLLTQHSIGYAPGAVDLGVDYLADAQREMEVTRKRALLELKTPERIEDTRPEKLMADKAAREAIDLG